MGSYLNPGNFSFRGSLRSKIYIDKSDLITKTNEALCTEQRYICVSRPRRFGKSMAANMLAAYYDRSEDTEKLFQNLAINKDRSYKENLNQYDVIKINMQEFLSMSKTIEEMLKMLKNYLISDFEETYPKVRFRDENNFIQVMKDVFSYTRCPFVILIDEWDCLFREYTQDKEAQKKYLDFLRAWLKDIKVYIELALKGDETIHERLELFQKQKQLLEEQLRSMQHTLDVLEYKCWYYETAEKAGTIAAPQNIPTDQIPLKYRQIRQELSGVPEI